MLPGWIIFAGAFGYLLTLFAVASYGDRKSSEIGRTSRAQPWIYALSLAIYCTSWTYFGGVGLAAHRGFEFLGIYIGPILVFTLGLPLLRRIIALAKAEKLTSVADFIAARYGKNSTVATTVALIVLVGTVPYIALQLKAISSTVSAMLVLSEPGLGKSISPYFDLTLIVTVVLACFSIMFGTRHTDATEHQDGLILAVAMESVLKLFAFLTAGICIVWFLFGGPTDLWQKGLSSELVTSALSYQTPISRWITLTILSAFAIIMLPRQFHVMVVENRDERQLKLAGVLFPAYLVVINLFVLPIAMAGLLTFGGNGDPDLYMLALPIAGNVPLVSLVTFIGGFSAATAMVIVDSVALSIMVSNDIIMPIFLRRKLAGFGTHRSDFAHTLLIIRRSAIFAILLLGYAYYRAVDSETGLASLGLTSFAAIAQIAPALLGGLIWRRANARGAVLGLTSGFVIWIYLLLMPSLGGPNYSGAASAILGFVFAGASVFSGPQADPLVNASVLSLLVNTICFVGGSLTRHPRPLERIQAGIFVKRRRRSQFATRAWKTGISIGELKAAIARYLGEERMQRSIATYEEHIGKQLKDDQPADMALIHFSEQLLGSAIGSASARLVLSLILQRTEDASSDTAWLLDQASEALQYNQDMLQTALSQMDQGIAVFDSSQRLSIWNRRFRQLLDLPEQVGQVGFPLAEILNDLAARGAVTTSGQLLSVENFTLPDKPFQLVLADGERIVEVRSNAMPGKGLVATFTDITQRVSADRALKQANETLEQRVAKRTAELTRVNTELADARAAADEANIGKTRFFAAAGHDILQPLNAARLYSSALAERMALSDHAPIARNIDSALESVEAILGAVLDISRLDTGAMRAKVSTVSLSEILERIATDFAPIAREKQLKLIVMPTSLHVRSDPNLLRRLVQNLVSNAIKYTITGKVLVGVRRNGKSAVIQVVDSGIGIPTSKVRTVFKEFARLDEGARTASGLGLGLSIVDRIARVLGHPVELKSVHGRGTDFRITLPMVRTSQRPKIPQQLHQRDPAEPLKGLHILCIDNEPEILEGMRLLLTGWGCRITTLTELVSESQVLAEGPFDLIIADYHLSHATGIDAIRRLRREAGMSIPALLVTADRSPEVRAEAEENAIAVQNKPVRPAALRAFITQLSLQRRAAAE
ncbi:PAS domain-containing hybrid sensor histidine kinase/response regulator [Oryzifoliimicrobium ureilyticus]|uniref:PAS domain-containing hybrid sensor histidine kinase/response regulator n=1 Tax=Oryzifoliimicrobium ureilyticus TaxID=3113724 RepID=UPI00307614CA